MVLAGEPLSKIFTVGLLIGGSQKRPRVLLRIAHAECSERTPRCVSATRQDTLAGAQGRAGQRRPPHAAPCLTQRPPRLRRRSAHCARARCRSHASSGRRRSAHCARPECLSNCVPSCVRGKPAPRTTRPAATTPGCSCRVRASRGAPRSTARGRRDVRVRVLRLQEGRRLDNVRRSVATRPCTRAHRGPRAPAWPLSRRASL